MPDGRDDAAGARAKAHYHDNIETAGYIVAGAAAIMFGPGLGEVAIARAGDAFFIPAGGPHAPFNHGEVPCTFVVAHSAADDPEQLAVKYERRWTIAAVVNALIGAGLRIAHLGEHPEAYWERFPRMPPGIVRRFPHRYPVIAGRWGRPGGLGTPPRRSAGRG